MCLLPFVHVASYKQKYFFLNININSTIFQAKHFAFDIKLGVAKNVQFVIIMSNWWFVIVWDEPQGESINYAN